MKGYLSLMLGSMIITLMLAMPGNVVQAEELEGGHCGCDVTVLTGAERNKMVADLNSSSVFKDVKENLKKSGYNWNGAGATEIIINHSQGDMILVGAKYTSTDGLDFAAAFLYINEQFIYMGLVPDQD